jgi:hypothetical protein
MVYNKITGFLDFVHRPLSKVEFCKLKVTAVQEIQSVSKRPLQWYSKCYCVASVKKPFTLKGVQNIHPLSC